MKVIGDYYGAVLYQGIHRRHGRLTPKDEAFDGQATEALVDFSASAVGDPTGPLGTDAP